MTTMTDWPITENVRCVSCPECAFTFDAVHVDNATDEYSCPACAELNLRDAVKLLTERIASIAACQQCGTTMPDHLVRNRFKLCDDCVGNPVVS